MNTDQISHQASILGPLCLAITFFTPVTAIHLSNADLPVKQSAYHVFISNKIPENIISENK